MKICLSAKPLLEALLSDAEFDPAVTYRPSVYNYIHRHNGAIYVFNTLSRRLASVNEAEAAMLSGHGEAGEDVRIAPLVQTRFLVPEDTDESALYGQLYEVLSLYESRAGYTQYEILPTTGCNARCFYCFEKGVEQLRMTPDTAEAVVAYIEKTRDPDKKITLAWYGGEPLCGTDVIDRICMQLSKRQIPFRSTMITNGSLWTDALIARAKALWALDKVQITLDGYGREHNRRKNYPAGMEDPFTRTVEAISALLEQGIGVDVRMNMDSQNAQSIRQLFGYLKERFDNRQRIVFSPAMLAESWFEWSAGRSCTQQKALREQWRLLREDIDNAGFTRFSPLQRSLPMYHCMANSPRSVTIRPDGKLSLCQTGDGELLYGDVWQGITDRALLDSWRCNTKVREQCKDCPWLPECTGFSMCPAQPSDCRSEMEDIFLRRLKKTIGEIL